MIHKEYQSHKHYLWQVYPRAKSKHSKIWGVYTTCSVIAEKISEREFESLSGCISGSNLEVRVSK